MLSIESKRQYGKALISLIKGDTKKLTVDTKIHRLCSVYEYFFMNNQSNQPKSCLSSNVCMFVSCLTRYNGTCNVLENKKIYNIQYY
jgi:hypothetical protein